VGVAYRELNAMRALSRCFQVRCLLRTVDVYNCQVLVKLKRLSEIAPLVFHRKIIRYGLGIHTFEAEAPPRLSRLTRVDLNPGSAPLNLIRLAKFQQKLGIQGQTQLARAEGIVYVRAPYPYKYIAQIPNSNTSRYHPSAGLPKSLLQS
jgi:hypothetical protein